MNPAFERTASILFRPFRFKTWLKIGFIAWLASAGSFGNFNVNVPTDQAGNAVGDAVSSFLAAHVLAIAFLVALSLVIVLVFIYLSCRFRFILLDAVLWRDPQISKAWRYFRIQANRYFVFLIGFIAACVIVLALVVGLPLWRALKNGAFNAETPWPFLTHYFIPMLLAALAFIIVAAIVSTLANDFMVPFMALDNITIGQAWGWLRQLMAAEPGTFAGYLGMKVVLSIAGGLVVGMAVLFLILLLAIPSVLVVVLTVLLLKGAGIHSLAITMIASGIGIVLAVALILILMMMASAPLAVFFTSYALYFLGGRYPRLGELLWPQPPVPVAPAPLVPPPPMPGTAPAT